jgi:hypothetical protein
MNKIAPRNDKKKDAKQGEWIITVLECSLSIILMVFFHSSTLDWMGKVKQSDRALYMDTMFSNLIGTLHMDTSFSGLTVTCTWTLSLAV